MSVYFHKIKFTGNTFNFVFWIFSFILLYQFPYAKKISFNSCAGFCSIRSGALAGQTFYAADRISPQDWI